MRSKDQPSSVAEQNCFHLAFPVDDLEAARDFYTRMFGCAVGRESDHWIDFDFFGHQIVAHLAPGECRPVARGPVDGKSIPVRHFGVVLEWVDWQTLADQLQARQADFYLPPTLRFQGQVGEQGTFFIADPAGNMLEFKSFKDRSQLFATIQDGVAGDGQ